MGAYPAMYICEAFSYSIVYEPIRIRLGYTTRIWYREQRIDKYQGIIITLNAESNRGPLCVKRLAYQCTNLPTDNINTLFDHNKPQYKEPLLFTKNLITHIK